MSGIYIVFEDEAELPLPGIYSEGLESKKAHMGTFYVGPQSLRLGSSCDKLGY